MGDGVVKEGTAHSADAGLAKTFDPSEAEPRIYAGWEASGAFEPTLDDRPGYAIMLPPPNVTGSLHIGHALNHTLQDILARFHRMRGYDVLWQPGTDHAGIATQMVVERQLREAQEPTRQELGREEFLTRVWAWKNTSGGIILEQDRRLGVSCAWKRERFTMDEGLSVAVRRAFVTLYDEGLITRGERLVNWDPHFQTAVSDLEVETVEVKGSFWRFRYPLADGTTYRFPVEHDEEGNPTAWQERDYIVVATTRPETMLGDTAVAVNPKDERYADLVGKMVRLPIAEAQIPIITDEHADPTKGTGAVKITPAHDFDDFAVGERHGLARLTIMDEQARMNAHERVPEAYRGLDRFEARKAIVAEMERLGFLDGIDETLIQQPTGDRSGVAIEPRLTDQWFCDAKALAGPALQAIEDGEARFVPANWRKTYDNWLKDIQPWCISRQLWWGHQIPAWYGPNGAVFVAEDEAGAVAKAKAHYGRDDVSVMDESAAPPSTASRSLPPQAGGEDKAAAHPPPRAGEVLSDSEAEGAGITLRRDPDVLDTWFSSALWPFSTLGWPDATPEQDKFYPGAVLVTAFDIIFFWVARMMMMGLKLKGEVPFKDIYIHALVRDEEGRKMSKSIGNVIDPIDVIQGCDLETLIQKRLSDARTDDKKKLKAIEQATRKQFPDGIERCGADALRFTLAAMAAQGRDVRLSVERIVGYRNFGTKVWNAARFAQINGCAPDPVFDPATAQAPVNRWIISEVTETAAAVTTAIEEYRFNDAAGAVYQFAWNTYCDWYLELIKPVLQGEDVAPDLANETRACAAWALDQLLALLHPFSPFISEELWANTAGPAGRKSALITAPWPDLPARLIDAEAQDEVGGVVRAITAIRAARGEVNVPPSKRAPLVVVGADAAARTRLERQLDALKRLARLESVTFAEVAPKGAIQAVADGVSYALPLGDLIDLDAEKARLTKEIAKMGEEIARLDKKLSNARFVANAPEELVAAEREKADGYASQKRKLEAALSALEEAG